MGISKENLDEFYMYLEKRGIKLLPYQKLLIKESVEERKPYVVCLPGACRTDFRMLSKLLGIVLEDKED